MTNKKIILWILILVCLVSSVLALGNTYFDNYYTEDNTFVDAVGVGNNLVNSGTVYTASGYINGAYNWNDNTDSITLAHDHDSSNGTISFWFKSNDASVNQLLLDYRGATNSNYLFIYLTGSDIRFKLNQNSNGYQAETTISGGLNSSQWYHVTATWGSNGMKLYINGKEEGTNAYTGTWVSEDNLNIGKYYASTSFTLDGILDEFWYSDEQFTINEISDIYNRSKLGEQYPFNFNTTSSSNFTISAIDSYNSSALNITADVLYNGTTYQFNGTSIDTNIVQSDSVANITLSIEGYDSKIYTNYNISNNIVDTPLNLTLGRIIFNSNIKDISDGSTVSNYTISAVSQSTGITYTDTTTNEDLILYVPKSTTTFETTINATGFAYAYTNISYTSQVNLTLGDYEIYPKNSIWFTFYNESSGLNLSGTTVNLDLISDLYAENYTNNTGILKTELLIPTDYIIRYGATGFNERFYYLTLEEKRHYDISLYLAPASSTQNITVTIVDQNTNTVEGAIVKALKYNIDTNTYETVSTGQTDINGETIFDLEYNSEFYKFVIQYDSETLKTTSPAYITNTEYTIQVVIGEEFTGDFDNFGSIDHLFSFNDSTLNFRFTYNDVDGVTDKICIYTYKTTATAKTLVNSSCSLSSAATILNTISNETAFYQSDAFYFVGNTNYYLDSYTHELETDLNLGNTGLFFQILLTLTLAVVVVWDLSLIFITVPLSLIIGKFLTLNTLGFETLFILQAVGLVLAFILYKRS